MARRILVVPDIHGEIFWMIILILITMDEKNILHRMF